MGEDEKLFDSAAWEYFLTFSREISEERERKNLNKQEESLCLGSRGSEYRYCCDLLHWCDRLLHFSRHLISELGEEGSKWILTSVTTVVFQERKYKLTDNEHKLIKTNAGRDAQIAQV